MTRKIEDQQDLPPVGLRVVRKGAPSAAEAPLEERIDLEATRQLHQHVAASGRLPRLLQGIQNQMTGRIHQPTQAEQDTITRLHPRGEPETCGACRHWDYPAAQQLLRQEGMARTILELKGPRATSLFGNWSKYGLCRVKDALAPFYSIAPSVSCRDYQPRKRGTFGRILGGVWKRLEEI